MADSEDAARVRAVLSRELETISHYETMARAAAAPEVRDFLLHLAAEEKEHVAEAVAVLGRLDAVQAGHLARPPTPEHFENPPPPAGKPPAPRSAQAASVSRLLLPLPGDTHDPHLAANPRLVMYSQPAPQAQQAQQAQVEQAADRLTVGHLKGAS